MPMDIRSMPAEVDASLIEDLHSVSFPTIGHFLEEGFVAPEIRAMITPVKIVGRAVTVKMTSPDSTLVHKATEMLQPGDVLLVDTGGDTRHAPVGEMVALAAQCRGASAVVIDGVCTDIVEIQEMNMPVFARGTSVLTTKLHGLDVGGINVPVSIGGVAVEPGDVVVGDDNGLLVMKLDVAGSVIEKARASDEREPATRDYLRDGGSLPERTAANRLIAAIQEKSSN